MKNKAILLFYYLYLAPPPPPICEALYINKKLCPALCIGQIQLWLGGGGEGGWVLLDLTDVCWVFL